ncbi:hypothetical protein MNV49_003212 [Pseudohyphozyma bogoriensis]|nr:hypothetical protein MNV49_003212 [Pseudohyphozyma bogoriensis]
MALPATLEDFITTQLAAFGFTDEGGSAGMIAGILEEESFEPEDKKLAILGALDLEEGDEKEAQVDQLITEAEDYREKEAARLLEAEELKAALKAKEAEEAAANKGKKVLTPEEEAQRKADLLKNFGYVEEEDEAEMAAKAEANKSPSAVYVDPKTQTKKARKKADAKNAAAGVDMLMQPNLNSAMVRGAELHRRQEDAARNSAKREKDKADLKKQKEDAAKKAEEKKKKAAKVERKA